jgi:hypothetical protein
MSSFTEILRKLEKGELPEELDFRQKEKPELDWSKIQYNTFYKSDEYILERYPNSMAFQHLPGGDKIIDAIKSKLTTPLEEMEERQAKILTNIITEYEEETTTNTNNV